MRGNDATSADLAAYAVFATSWSSPPSNVSRKCLTVLANASHDVIRSVEVWSGPNSEVWGRSWLVYAAREAFILTKFVVKGE